MVTVTRFCRPCCSLRQGENLSRNGFAAPCGRYSAVYQRGRLQTSIPLSTGERKVN